VVREEKEIGNGSLEGRKERFGLTPRKENTKKRWKEEGDIRPMLKEKRRNKNFVLFSQ